MDSQNNVASEAAATAPKADFVTPEKLTPPFSRKASSCARSSLRTAIDAKCKSCIYDRGSGNGGWREQVQSCSSTNCPLHPVRPLPVKVTKTGDPAASRVMTAAAVGSTLPAGKVGSNDLISDERRAA